MDELATILIVAGLFASIAANGEAIVRQQFTDMGRQSHPARVHTAGAPWELLPSGAPAVAAHEKTSGAER
jgi:hypothetical protein